MMVRRRDPEESRIRAVTANWRRVKGIRRRHGGWRRWRIPVVVVSTYVWLTTLPILVLLVMMRGVVRWSRVLTIAVLRLYIPRVASIDCAR
jgi:hypothetical protein